MAHGTIRNEPIKLLLLVLVFAELSQNAACRFRVQESDAQAFGATAWSLVDEADAEFLGLFKLTFKVFDCESDVVHAATAAVLFDESGDGAFGACRFKEFDFGLSAAQESGLHFLVCNFFNGIAFRAKKVLEEWNGFFQAGNSDSNVLDV